MTWHPGDEVPLELTVTEPDKTYTLECPKCALVYGSDYLPDDCKIRCPICNAPDQQVLE